MFKFCKISFIFPKKSCVCAMTSLIFSNKSCILHEVFLSLPARHKVERGAQFIDKGLTVNSLSIYIIYISAAAEAILKCVGGRANLGESGGMLRRKILKFRGSEMARNASFLLK